MIQSFPPVLPETPNMLILGSMPGIASLRAQQYYAHPRNLFWAIIGALLGFDPNNAYEERISALKRTGIALWDVLQTCERDGSLDSNIKPSTETANKIDKLLIEHPGISSVFLNGHKATTAFRRHIAPLLKDERNDVEIVTLPSSSAANARLTAEQKSALWHQAIAPKLTNQRT